MQSYFEGRAFDPKTGKFAENKSFIEVHTDLNLHQINIDKDFTTRYVADEEHAFNIEGSYIEAYYDLDAKNIIIHTINRYSMHHFYERKRRDNEKRKISVPSKICVHRYPGAFNNLIYYGKLLHVYQKLNIVIIKIKTYTKFAIYRGYAQETFSGGFVLFTDFGAEPTKMYITKIGDQFVISTLQEGRKPIQLFDNLSEIATHVAKVNGAEISPPCEIEVWSGRTKITSSVKLDPIINGDVYRIENNYFMLVNFNTDPWILDVEMIKCPIPMKTKAALHEYDT